MRWRDVIKRVRTLLNSDEQFTGAMGGKHIYRNGDMTEVRIPGLFWTIVADVEGENTVTVRVQFDLWHNDWDAYIIAETRIRALLDPQDADMPLDLDGLKMFSSLVDSGDMDDHEPGVIHRVLDFVFTPHK